jgi:signal transduction histidine kinase
MGLVSGRFGSVGWRPFVVDAGLGLVVMVIALLHLFSKAAGGPVDVSTGVTLSVFAGTAVVFRRFAPFTVLGLTTLAVLAFTIVEQMKSPIAAFMAVAVYTVVTRKGRWTRTVVVGGAAIGTIAVSISFTDGDLFTDVFSAVLVLFAAVLGEAVLYRRAYLDELEQRALRAELSREAEAERRVIDERLRIAHELHDVIAHHIALMNIQANVASELLPDRPDQVEQALSMVRQSGRTVLQELTVLLGVLRRPGVSLPTAPTPSLRELDPLIESFVAAGLEIDWAPANAGSLPDVVELTVYRIVQESLTNVVKHAPGARVAVELKSHRGALLVTVTDDGGRAHPPYGGPVGGSVGSGHGLIGMRERVMAVGGELVTGRAASGGFCVRAVIPVETGAVDDDSGVAGRRPDLDPQRVPGAGGLSTGTRGGR